MENSTVLRITLEIKESQFNNKEAIENFVKSILEDNQGTEYQSKVLYISAFHSTHKQ